MSRQLATEFYVECYLRQSSGPSKIADLACQRTEDAYRALAENLTGMYRPQDGSRIELRLRGASPSDVAAVSAALDLLSNPSVRRAWGVAGAAVSAGRQHGQFNPDYNAPKTWVSQVEGVRVGSAVWRDGSWGNNAAPSWELVEGDVVVAEAFYYTLANGDRCSEHFEGRPYVSVVMFDEDENPTIAFESSPDDFVMIVLSADGRTEPPAGALIRAAEGVPQEGRIYWDRDI